MVNSGFGDTALARCRVTGYHVMVRYANDVAGHDALDAFPNGPCALNFANTVGDHLGDGAYDFLDSYDALVAWCRRAGAIAPSFARELLAHAKKSPRRAQAALASAMTLRRAIYDVMSATAHSHAPPRAALVELNAYMQHATAQQTLRYTGGAFVREWHDDPANLESLLWPIARSAADVLTSEHADRIVECEGHACTWIFIDETKNRSKRFCRSTGCGNRARVRRFYARHLT